MKYIAIDELNHFEFHDAALEAIQICKDQMEWRLFSVNATTENSQNYYPDDMCIKDAKLIFEHFAIEKIVFWAYQTMDSDRNIVESVPDVEASSDQYDDILKRTMEKHCYLFSMNELPNTSDNRKRATFVINNAPEVYDLTLSYTKSIVQWDEYDGKAWYVEQRLEQ